jgi:hypothetical protein
VKELRRAPGRRSFAHGVLGESRELIGTGVAYSRSHALDVVVRDLMA